MKILALGTGSAFTLNNYQTSFLIDDELLFDCGGDVRFALRDQGLTYKNIKNVFISHLHNDHIGGLEWLGFSKYFDPTEKLPNLIISESLVEDLWNKCLCGGMGSLQGLVCNLHTYFDVWPIERNGKFGYPIVKSECQLIQTVHIMNGYYIVLSFGLMVTDFYAGKKIFFTGDTQFCPEQIMDFYKVADVIFQDCEYLYLPDGKPIKSRVHAHFEDLKTLDPMIKNKMWLVHYQDIVAADWAGDFGFKGFLKKGQVIKI